jgi:ATP-dependent helicase Lhr and Lhr-like helicase
VHFSAATRAWFTSVFAEPTEAQDRGWDAIGRGEHTLILAPTGSGKTLAAFLSALDRLVTRPGTGCRVLYVSPLKALSYDVERNLQVPLAGIAREADRLGIEVPRISVATRTGDTPAEERRAMGRRPPDILITTPESLYLLLTSRAATTLASVQLVIVDEIHALAATKRGAHLALSLERLERLTTASEGGAGRSPGHAGHGRSPGRSGDGGSAGGPGDGRSPGRTPGAGSPTGRPPQRIGLSATQRPLDELARFLGGQVGGRPRDVTVVDAGVRKVLDLSIVVPVEDMGRLGRPSPGDVEGPGSGSPSGPAPRRQVATGGEPAGGERAGGGVGGGGPVDGELAGGSGGGGVTGVASGRDRRGVDPAEASGSIWPAVYPALLELIRAHRSTLIFVNSRRLAERLAARLNELAAEDAAGQTVLEGAASFSGSGAFTSSGAAFLGTGVPADVVRAHHGSIAREQRLEIEDALKAGRLPALVATSSLELGIDMGAIDLVIQIEAPTSVASGLQRIGRAGHQVGAPSVGRIFPKFRHDLLVAAVVAQRMHAGLVEETRVPRNPLDVLAQQIVAHVAATGGAVSVDQLYETVTRAYPYADLSREAYEGVLDMLAGRYPSDEFAELRPRLTWDRLAGDLAPRPGAQMLAVVSGGTIPDRGLFGVFTPEGGRVGELDEEMVYESRVGETFLLGATTWRILEITRDRVVVTPAPGLPGKMPFWHGDGPGRPFELGQAVGAFIRTLAERSDDELAGTFDLDPLAVDNLRAYVAEEREATGGLLPTDRQIVVERFRDELGDRQIAVLSPFGARVHAPWATAIEARLRERTGAEVHTVWSDDGIIVRLPDVDEDAEDAAAGVDRDLLDTIFIDPADIEDLVVAAVGASSLFAGRFRENAARSLLLPRRRPGSRTPLWQMRQRAADLLAVASRYASFPILLETYRECLRDVFDLPALTGLLADVAARRVRVASVELATPSPFAGGLVSAYVAQFMYDGDAPLAERRAQALTLDRRMLAELLGTDELRDLLDGAVLDAREVELQALDERRRARDVDGVADLLRRLGDLSAEEVAARASEDLAAPALATLVAAGRVVPVRIGGEERFVVVEDAGRYRDALGVVIPAGLPDTLLNPVPDALVQLVRRWARRHGPFQVGEPAARFGVSVGRVAEVLAWLAGEGRVVRGAFRPGGIGGDEWCDTEVLRVLRERSLAALRREVEPAEREVLARFAPAWQGVAPVGVAPTAGGLDRLFEVVAQLQGVPIPASVLERDVLAARVRGYTARMLDDLLASGEIMWVGAGSLGRDDGRVVLALRDHARLVLPRLGHAGILGGAGLADSNGLHDHLRSVLAARGACFFRDLARPGATDAEIIEALWDLVWAGEVTGDAFAAVRATVSGASRRRGGASTSRPKRSSGALTRPRPRPGQISALGPPRGQGRWSLVERELGARGEAGATEAGVAVAGLLLERHGILTREAVRGEGVPGGFAGIYPVLRAMEESGRIRRGYFVAGMGGAQFALPGAVDRLRSLRQPTRSEEGAVVVLAATDPANVLGLSLPWPVKGPARVAGAYVVLVSGVPSAYLERGGRGLVALRPLDGRWEEQAVAALSSLVAEGHWSRLVLQQYPESLEAVLRAANFTPTPRGLVHYGRPPAVRTD